MAKHLLHGLGQIIWRETIGKPLHVEPGGTTTTTTTTGGPSSCAGLDPEMYLTIFDADYAGGDITWCGETWSQADVQAGAEKGPICPTLYNSKVVSPPYPSYPTVSPTISCANGHRQYWRFGTAGNAQFGLVANWLFPFTVFGWANLINRVRVNPPGAVIMDKARRVSINNTCNPPPTQINLVTGEAYTPFFTPYLGSGANGSLSLFYFGPLSKSTLKNSNLGECAFNHSPIGLDGFIHDVLKYGNMTDVAGIKYIWRPGAGW